MRRIQPDILEDFEKKGVKLVARDGIERLGDAENR